MAFLNILNCCHLVSFSVSYLIILFSITFTSLSTLFWPVCETQFLFLSYYSLFIGHTVSTQSLICCRFLSFPLDPRPFSLQPRITLAYSFSFSLFSEIFTGQLLWAFRPHRGWTEVKCVCVFVTVCFYVCFSIVCLEVFSMWLGFFVMFWVFFLHLHIFIWFVFILWKKCSDSLSKSN